MTINPFIGWWYITEMDAWDDDFFNMDGEAFIQIDEDGGRRFGFGAVQSEIDGKEAEERFEFSFQVFDECDLVSGWSWFTLKGSDTVDCEIRFFQGEESGFVAERQK